MAHVDPSFCLGGFEILGFSWMNLAELDPTWILPVINGLGMVATILLNSENQPGQMKKFMLCLAGASVLFTASAVPSGVLLYWITQNIFLTIQGQILKRPTVRRFFNIPLLPVLSEQQKAEAKAKAEAQLTQAWNLVKGKGMNPQTANQAQTNAPATNPFAAPSNAAPPTAAQAQAAAATLAAASNAGKTSPAASFYTKPAAAAGSSKARGKQAPRKR